MITMRLRFHNRRFLKKIVLEKTYCTANVKYKFPTNENEYTTTPEYPPIERVDKEYLKKKELQLWYDKIKRQKTVEEKLFEINIPRYWGWKCMILKEGQIPYNSLELTQYITRTHLIETEVLPGHCSDIPEKYSELVKEVNGYIQDTIIEQQLRIRHKHAVRQLEKTIQERESTKAIVNELNSVLLKVLNKYQMNIENVQIDYSPRLEAFWNLGSLKETYKPERYPDGLPAEEIPEEYLSRPSDKYLQYFGYPIIQLRIENPLPQILDLSETTTYKYSFPIYNYDPFYVFGYEMDRRHVTNIPGFWPGDTREFSFLSYHDSNHLKYRPDTYGPDDFKETLQCQAILASFAWLMSLTGYQGFTTFHDVTYPFVTQTIITDGKMYSFAVYQLNTTELHHEDPLQNQRCNICWITPPVELYKNIEDGKIIGFNEEVIKVLLQFYMNKSEAKSKCIRKPYLDEKVEFVSNYEHDEKRNWLEDRFKHFSSNRPFHRIDKMYELADFERIYKVQFRKLIRDARTRPFELRENPYLRKMSDHAPQYIPRVLRPDKHLPKWRQQKFKKTYYPE